MPNLETAAALLLAAFLPLAAYDGIYLHLWRYRLFARAESRREHFVHTADAVLFAPTVFLLYVCRSGGALLWIAVGLVAIAQLVALADLVSERDSRASLGGLSTTEYVLHVVIMSLRTASIALILAARPEGAWSLESAWRVGELDGFVRMLGIQAAAGGVVMAALHLWLCAPRWTASRPIGAAVATGRASA
jgi:hypothetical protein